MTNNAKQQTNDAPCAPAQPARSPLMDALADIAAVGKEKMSQGAHEFASALFNGTAYVQYGGNSAPAGRDDGQQPQQPQQPEQDPGGLER